MNVVAYQVDLMMRLPLGGMGSHLGGRTSEYQPSASGIHRVEAKRVLKKRARCNSVVREQNRVEADDHVGESVLAGLGPKADSQDRSEWRCCVNMHVPPPTS
jgi:hypothetical protein